MGKKAEQFLKESKENRIEKEKKYQSRRAKANELMKSKRNLLFQLLGYFIIIVGVLYTVYRFDNQEIELPTTIVLIIVSLFFGGIFILIGKHYS